MTDLYQSRPYRFPLNRIETDYYKFRDVYESGPWAGKPHPGVDFHEANGARVYAIGEGVVVKVGYDEDGYGHYTMIEHWPALWSLYAHLSAPPLHWEGTRLVGDDIPIGREGYSGAANDIPHLHFELKRTAELGLYPQLTVDNLNEFYYDPYVFLPDPGNVFLPTHCWGCPYRGCAG
jgi:murein DD-endopeptidase MepM/ murein hydrolase activator NlpD